LNTCSRALATFLVPLEGEPLVSVCCYRFPMIHWFISFLSICVSWINTPLFRQPRMSFRFLSHYLNFFFNDEPSQTYYSYIGLEFPKVLDKPEVEYRQVNLTVPCALMELNFFATCSYLSFPSANISATFEPPAGHSNFDYIFDFTGEVRHDRTEMVVAIFNCRDILLMALSRYKSTLPLMSRDR